MADEQQRVNRWGEAVEFMRDFVAYHERPKRLGAQLEDDLTRAIEKLLDEEEECRAEQQQEMENEAASHTKEQEAGEDALDKERNAHDETKRELAKVKDADADELRKERDQLSQRLAACEYKRDQVKEEAADNLQRMTNRRDVVLQELEEAQSALRLMTDSREQAMRSWHDDREKLQRKIAAYHVLLEGDDD